MRRSWSVVDAGGWRGLVAGPVVAAVTLVAALVATRRVGLPVRDPDHVAALYLVLVGLGMVLLVVLGLVVGAVRHTGTRRPSREAIAQARRERWTLGRTVAVGTALLSFYVSYMAYRNLKSIVPLLRPGELFDDQLADFDRDLFTGSDPAALLHSLLGTTVTPHVVSTAYVAFIVFLPLSLAVALVFCRDVRSGLFYATALSLNWPLGAASYLLLPSLGPIYADPAAFAALPHTEVTHLQAVLLDQRVAFLRDAAGSLPQSIAAFASLHISMSLTAAISAHLLGGSRRLKAALWTWLAVTTIGTIYLGWHYVVDDLGGVLIAALAIVLARVLTGYQLRREQHVRPLGSLRRPAEPAFRQEQR